jgi:hypothetical protein
MTTTDDAPGFYAWGRTPAAVISGTLINPDAWLPGPEQSAVALDRVPDPVARVHTSGSASHPATRQIRSQAAPYRVARPSTEAGSCQPRCRRAAVFGLELPAGKTRCCSQ